MSFKMTSKEFSMPCKECNLKYFLTFFKVLGVAPMKCGLSSKNKEARKLLVGSTSGIIYNLFLAIFVIVISYYSLVLVVNVDYPLRVNFEKNVDVITACYQLFTTLFILAIFCIRREEAVDIANRINGVSLASKSLDPRNTKLQGVRYVVIINTLTHIIIIFTPNIGGNITLTSGTVFNLSVLLQNLIMNAMIMQYSVILKVIRHIYRVINDCIIDMFDPWRELNLITKLYDDGQTKTKKLAQLKELYVSISRLSADLSNFYSLLMLVSTPNIFIIILTYSYYCLREFIFEQSVTLSSMGLVHCACQVVFSAASLIVLTRSATETVNESKRTGEILNEFVGRTQNIQIVNQINQFSSYLLHKNIQFTVYKLFTLDESLIISITGYITTYLIILFQVKEQNL